MENNQTLIKIPGYRSAEYILILSPHEALQERIMKIKRQVWEKYDNGFLMSKKPVLTLSRFFSLEIMEEKLKNHFKLAAMGMPPFKVNLKDYSCIPNYSLSINVTSKIPLQILMKDIKTAKRLIRSANKKPFFNNDFSIPLAVKLTTLQFNKMWQDFKIRQFTGNFIADSMLLLKRLEGEKHFQIAARFEFQNLPVSIRQGELFG